VTGRARIKLRGREEPVRLENTFAGTSPLPPALRLVWLPLEALLMNPFEKAEIESLHVEADVQEGLKAARIESARLDKLEVEPGEEVQISVNLKEFQGARHLETVTITVPEDAQPGSTADIIVCDSMVSLLQEMQSDPGLFQPTDMEGLIRMIEGMPSSKGLYARASFVREGLRYEGAAMPRLPASVSHILTSGTTAGDTLPLTQDVTGSTTTPWVVEGMVRLTVQVRKPGEGTEGLQ